MKLLVPLALAVLIAGMNPASAAIETYTATLTGTQEVPPNGSPGTGTATLLLDTVTNVLTVDLSFGGLTSAQTAAHIHGPAAVGVNAGVLHALPMGSFTGHIINSNATVVGHIRNGLTYVNVHTTNFPGGEIRGQLTLAPVPVPEPGSLEESGWSGVKALYR